MIRMLFAALVVVHGLIHLTGFSRSFNYTQDKSDGRIITRANGIMWLVTTVLFIISAVLIVLKRDWWHVSLLSVVLSQILIFTVWKQAKFGSLANIGILALAVVNFAGWRFQYTAKEQGEQLMAAGRLSKVTLTDIQSQPPVVRKWLMRSGIVGKPAISTVRLKQRGLLRTKPGDKWMPVAAEQYISVAEPAFLWVAKINAGIVHIAGKDQYEKGKGEMIIKMASIAPIADATGPELDQGSLLRYLAEIQWYPSAALSPCIKWTQINDHAAVATITCNGLSVWGTFSFNEPGDIIAFEADRYMEHKGTYTLERWYVPVTGYRVFHGIRIPSEGKTIWKLKAGDFNWFEWKITDINYNPAGTY